MPAIDDGRARIAGRGRATSALPVRCHRLLVAVLHLVARCRLVVSQPALRLARPMRPVPWSARCLPRQYVKLTRRRVLLTEAVVRRGDGQPKPSCRCSPRSLPGHICPARLDQPRSQPMTDDLDGRQSPATSTSTNDPCHVSILTSTFNMAGLRCMSYGTASTEIDNCGAVPVPVPCFEPGHRRILDDGGVLHRVDLARIALVPVMPFTLPSTTVYSTGDGVVLEKGPGQYCRDAMSANRAERRAMGFKVTPSWARSSRG